jgi:hypothetical protein
VDSFAKNTQSHDRDGDYQLAGMVELDDAYFGGPTEGGKRRRGTEKTQVLVGVSVTDKGNPPVCKNERAR